MTWQNLLMPAFSFIIGSGGLSLGLILQHFSIGTDSSLGIIRIRHPQALTGMAEVFRIFSESSTISALRLLELRSGDNKD
jgi:hypothetical protein